MKKLMFAAAIALAAVCANAASVTWMLSDITDSPDNTAKAGMVAYFMDASTYDTFIGKDASEVASYVLGNYKWDGATYLEEGRFGDSINLNETDAGPSYPNRIDGYIVLFDTDDAATAKNYAYTAVKGAAVAQNDAPITLSYGTFAAGTSGWQSIPEPTSGLLLLIGVAGLALRRRRA